jgi:hypothetical protein
MLAIASWVVINPPDADQQHIASSDPGSVQSEPPSEEVERRNLTPDVEIGSGTLGEMPYTLNAQVAELVYNEKSTLALCTDWTYGPPPGTGSDCEPFNPDQSADTLQVVSDESNAETGTAAFFGTAPPSTASIEFELEDGSKTEARILDSPAELDLPLVFFVGSAPVGETRIIIAKGSTGEILAQKKPPQL